MRARPGLRFNLLLVLRDRITPNERVALGLHHWAAGRRKDETSGRRGGPAARPLCDATKSPAVWSVRRGPQVEVTAVAGLSYQIRGLVWRPGEGRR